MPVKHSGSWPDGTDMASQAQSAPQASASRTWWPSRYGRELGEWLADHQVALTGCDTRSFGPYPPERPDEPFVVPQTLNVRHGIVVVENLRLAEAARARVHEFLLVISHAKLRGATGAWVAPLAIV